MEFIQALGIDFYISAANMFSAGIAGGVISGYSAWVRSGENIAVARRAAATTYLTQLAFTAVGSASTSAGDSAFWNAFDSGASVAQSEAAASFASTIVKVGGHALVGCFSAEAGGGDCGRGALSQAVSAGFTVAIRGTPVGNNFYGALAGNMAIGGITSRLSGGDFWAGARTAAMGYLFNEVASAMREEQKYTRNFHDYRLNNQMCDFSNSACSVENLQPFFEKFSRPTAFIPSDFDPNSASYAGYGLLLGGWVRQFGGSGSVMNVTTVVHTLHPGFVVRSLEIRSDGIYVDTIGMGWVPSPRRELNVFFGKNIVFPSLDSRIKIEFCAKYGGC